MMSYVMGRGGERQNHRMFARIIAAAVGGLTLEQFAEAEMARMDACHICGGVGNIAGVLTCPMCGGSGVDPDKIDRDWDAYERMQEQARREQKEAAWKAREVRR